MSNNLQSVITSKGQITLPIQIRKRLNLSAGHKVAFCENSDGSYSLHPATLPLSSLEGILAGKVSGSITLEDMESAIERMSE